MGRPDGDGDEPLAAAAAAAPAVPTGDALLGLWRRMGGALTGDIPETAPPPPTALCGGGVDMTADAGEPAAFGDRVGAGACGDPPDDRDSGARGTRFSAAGNDRYARIFCAAVICDDDEGDAPLPLPPPPPALACACDGCVLGCGGGVPMSLAFGVPGDGGCAPNSRRPGLSRSRSRSRARGDGCDGE